MSPLRVIVVEDQVSQRLVIRHHLKAAGMNVTAVGSAREAAEYFAGCEYAVVDLTLDERGVAGGLALVRELAARGLAVFVYSGTDQASEVQLCMDYGAIDFVQKAGQPAAEAAALVKDIRAHQSATRFYGRQGLQRATKVIHQIQNQGAAARGAILLLAAFCILVSLTVLTGLMIGRPELTTFAAGPAVSMKWSTALAGLVAGISLLLAHSGRPYLLSWFGGAICGLLIGSLGNLFVRQLGTEYESVAAGVPSLFTFGGHMCHIWVLRSIAVLRVDMVAFWGLLIALLGASTLLGHLVDRPRLYGHWDGWSTGCAIPTGVQLLAIGIGVLLIYRNYSEEA